MKASGLFFAGFMIMAAVYFGIQIYEGDAFVDDGETRNLLDWVVVGFLFISGMIISHLTQRFLDNRYIVTKRSGTLDRKEYR